MKIDNCVRIIDGELHSSPSIDAFERIVFESSKILRGDLFIDLHRSIEASQEAILNGAYAVISTLDKITKDEEIAWIRVSSIEQSLIKLLRYTIHEKVLRIVCLSELEGAFLEIIHTPKQIKHATHSLPELLLQLLKAKNEETFWLSDRPLCDLIAPSALLIHPTIQPNQCLSKGLFLSSFAYHDSYFVDQKIPALFVPTLVNVLAFCEEQDIAYELSSLHYSEHFYPQFVTPSLRKKEFGSSDKVLIFEPLDTLLPDEIAYLESSLSSSLWVLYLPIEYPKTFTCSATIILYKHPEELEALRHSAFQFALILGERALFEPFLTQTFTTQPSLF